MSSCLWGLFGKVQGELGPFTKNKKVGSQVFSLETGGMCVCGEGLPVSAGHGQMKNFVSFSES